MAMVKQKQALSAFAARFKEDRRGLSAVEFALISPLLLFCLGGTFDVSRYVWAKSDLTKAIRGGMQHAIASPADLGSISSIIRNATSLSSDTQRFSSPTPDCGCAPALDARTIPASWGACEAQPCPNQRKYMRIQASYRFVPLVGTMLGVLPDTATSVIYMRVQ